MSKAVWNIVIIGILTTLLMVVGMLMSLSSFQGTPAWTQTKLSESIKSQFDYLAAGTEIKTSGIQTTLLVAYEAKPGKAALSSALATEEMQKTAEFAIKAYEGRDRGSISHIQVRRSETRGSGCFQNVYRANHEIPNPLKRASGNALQPPDASPLPAPTPLK